MGSAYTPGLTVSADTVVDRVRRLPIKGEVLVREGDSVQNDSVVARALLPGMLQTVRLADRLGVEPKEVPALTKVAEGDHVTIGQTVAETEGILGFFKTKITCDYEGTVEGISPVTGNMLVREAPIPVEITAYVTGKVTSVVPEEGAVVQTRGAMVQGIFGIGGEQNGIVTVKVSGPDQVLDESMIGPEDAGKVIVGGAGVTLQALTRANEVGAAGVVVGAVRDVDLTALLGYDIGVAITGQEDVRTTLVATEGFGKLDMAGRTFKLLQSLEGRRASINGATQIRAGVIRPELIAPVDHAPSEAVPQHSSSMLEIGVPIRIIREPYFGTLGKVTGLPAQLQTVESGAEVRVLEAKLDDGRDVVVPRANVEIIATS